MLANLALVKISGKINHHAGFNSVAGTGWWLWRAPWRTGVSLVQLGGDARPPLAHDHMLLSATISWHTIAGEGIL
jgi:hypothetical protein